MTTLDRTRPKIALPDGPFRRPRFAMLRTILALVIREVIASNGRLVGGYLWAIAAPAAGIAFFSIVMMALGMRQPALGNNFPIFFATGMLTFGMAMHAATSVMGAVNQSRHFLAYPRVTILDSVLARLLYVMLTDLLVFYIVITFILLVWDTRTTLEMPRILLAVAMAFSLGLGLGLVNCVLTGLWPIYQKFWSLMSRPLFLISGTIFVAENIPQPWRGWIEWNPLIHVTAQMRTAFYSSYDALWISPVYVFGVAGVLCLSGLLFLRRYYRDILER